MKKLLYILLLLPFLANAQIYTQGAKTGNPFIRNAGTDKYPVTFSPLINGGHHSYATLAGRDSLNSYYPLLLRDGMQVYVRQTGDTYRWNTTTQLWETITYGNIYTAGYGLNLTGLQFRVDSSLIVSKLYLSALNSNLLHKTGDETKVGNLAVTSLNANASDGNAFLFNEDVSIYNANTPNTWIVKGSSDPSTAFFNFGSGPRFGYDGTNYVIGLSPIFNYSNLQFGSGLNYNSGTGVLSATGTGSVTSVTRGLGFQNTGTSITSTGTLEIDTTTSAGVLGKGAANTRYNYLLSRINTIPAANLQNVTNAGNTTTNRMTTPGLDGVAYMNYANQTTLATPVSGQVNTGFIGGSPAWRNVLGQRRLRTSFNGDIDYYLPMYNSSTVQKLASVDSVEASYVKKVGDVMTGNLSISNANPAYTVTTTGGNSASFSRPGVSNRTVFTNQTVPIGGLGQAFGALSGSQFSTASMNDLPVGANSFSLSFWLKRTASGVVNLVTQYGNGIAANSMRLELSGTGSPTIYHSNTTLSGGINLATNIWYYFTYTFDGAVGREYINGSLITSSTITTPSITAGAWRFGLRSDAVSPFTGGEIDQAAIYNRQITVSEIQQNYNSGFGVANLVSNGLVRVYNFDGNGVDALGPTLMTFPSGSSFDLNGKTPSATGGLSTVSYIEHQDATRAGTQSTSTFGGINDEVILRGKIVSKSFNGVITEATGLNGSTLKNPSGVSDADASGNYTSAGIDEYGPTGLSTKGQIRLVQDEVDLIANANRVGAIKLGLDNRIQVVTGAATVSKIAYTSDATVKTLFNQGTFATVLNTTTETSAIGGAGTGTLVLPANFLTQYKQLRINFSGVYGSQTLSQPNLTIRVYIGSVMVAQGTASSFFLGATNNTFNGNLDINTMATGTTGSVYAQGLFNYNGTNNVNFNTTSLDLASGTATINTTVSNTVSVTYQWGAASPNNTVSTRLFTLLSLN